LADKAQIAFDTVRSLLARPSGGNVRSLEKLCAALGQLFGSCSEFSHCDSLCSRTCSKLREHWPMIQIVPLQARKGILSGAVCEVEVDDIWHGAEHPLRPRSR
jgi:hypothetical protein